MRASAASFCFLLPRPPSSTLFPYTTLFRSQRLGARLGLHARAGVDAEDRDLDQAWVNEGAARAFVEDRKSTRLNSSHVEISYAGFCLKKKKVVPMLFDGHHVTELDVASIPS